jgi:hypothetical protein
MAMTPDSAVQQTPSCIVDASCTKGDHSLTWPCVYATGTGERWKVMQLLSRAELAESALARANEDNAALVVVIEAAPHDTGCALRYEDINDSDFCICWKSEAPR